MEKATCVCQVLSPTPDVPVAANMNMTNPSFPFPPLPAQLMFVVTEWAAGAFIPMVIAYALMYGGLGQLLAGILEVRVLFQTRLEFLFGLCHQLHLLLLNFDVNAIPA